MSILLLIVSLPLVFFYFTSISRLNYKIAKDIVYKNNINLLKNIIFIFFIYLLSICNLYFIFTHKLLPIVCMNLIILLSVVIVFLTHD